MRRHSIESTIEVWAEWHGVKFSQEAMDDLVNELMKGPENETRSENVRASDGTQTQEERPQGRLGGNVQRTLIQIIEAGSRRIRRSFGQRAGTECNLRSGGYRELCDDDRVERLAPDGGYSPSGNGSAIPHFVQPETRKLRRGAGTP